MAYFNDLMSLTLNAELQGAHSLFGVPTGGHGQVCQRVKEHTAPTKISYVTQTGPRQSSRLRPGGGGGGGGATTGPNAPPPPPHAICQNFGGAVGAGGGVNGRGGGIGSLTGGGGARNPLLSHAYLKEVSGGIGVHRYVREESLKGLKD